MGSTAKCLGALAVLVVVTVGCTRRGASSAGELRPDSVSVGYGSQATGAVAASVQTLVPDSSAHLGTVVDMLEGKVAGLQVIRMSNGGVSLRIRGTNSINGSNEPLVIIDDVMVPPDGVGGALLAVAPGEVQQIDILKDAGATAIYGSRGANGVIVIRTKRAH